MSFLSFFLGEKNKKTASTAKERLQLIIAHERANSQQANYLPQLQQELIEVIRKYVPIDPDDIKLHIEKQDDLEILEVKIEFPEAKK